MIMETKFSVGDSVYSIGQFNYPNKMWMVSGVMTIGQVRKEVTDSPGRPGEELFDNFKAQSSTKEQYMCIETGIGTGNLYSVENLFATKEDAKAEADKRNEMELAA